MKKTVAFVLILVVVSCGNDTAKKTVDNNSAKKHTINYPLPKTADSLLALLKMLPDDTNKINVLNTLGWKLKYTKPDTSIILSNQALSISKKVQWKNGMATSLGQLGVYYRLETNYSKALDYLQKALKVDEELNNKSGIAKRLGNIGTVYWNEGDYPKAMDNYLKALKMTEELGNKQLQANNLGNIGNLYKEQGNCSKALDYYLKALKMDEELGDKNGTSVQLSNIGTVYYSLADSAIARKSNAVAIAELYNKALDYQTNALKIDEELGNKIQVASDLGNIGGVYAAQEDYPKAFENYFKALHMDEELGNKNGIAIKLGNIGALYTKNGKYKEAYTFLYHALAVSDSIDAKNLVMSKYEMLSTLYEKSTIPLSDTIGGKSLNKEEMRLRALHYFKSYMNLRDTIFSEENKKQLVRKEMNFEFEKKEAATKSEQDKKDVLAKEELKQKENERNYFITGFGLVILLAGFILRGYKQKQKANEIISAQKILVEEKQKEILDSIHYAKRIQQSLLPTEKYIQKNIKRLSKN